MSSSSLNSYTHSLEFLVSSSRSFLLRLTFMGLVIFGEDILSWIFPFVFVFVLCWNLHIWSQLVERGCEPRVDNIRTTKVSSVRELGELKKCELAVQEPGAPYMSPRTSQWQKFEVGVILPVSTRGQRGCRGFSQTTRLQGFFTSWQQELGGGQKFRQECSGPLNPLPIDALCWLSRRNLGRCLFLSEGIREFKVLLVGRCSIW